MKRMDLDRKERLEVRQIIKEKTGYVIRSKRVLHQIFRRSSFAAENGESSNEIFEFIGDQVLSYFVVKIVSKRCGSLSITGDYTFRICENRFTLIKQSFVNNEALAKIIDEWDIAKYLLLGRSDIKNNVGNEPKVKADLLEAIIGAIAVDSKWDSEVLEVAVSKVLNIDETLTNIIESDIRVRWFDIDNAITVLKEIAEKGQCTMPQYSFSGPIGYDGDGNPRWFCNCYIINEKIGIIRSVWSTSKKAAKKAVAYLILCEHFNVQNKYGPNDFYSDWVYKDGKLIPSYMLNGNKQ